MSNLRDMLSSYVSDGSVPGAVALVARGDDIEVAAVGSIDVQGSVPMARDTIFRSASISKPITAAATMMLVDDGRIALDDPVSKWLPELQSPVVVRTPDGPVEDVVPAARPITVFDLLTFRAGYGFPADFSLSVVALLASDVQADGREPQRRRAPGEWMASLARIPLVYQPGQAWLYNTGSDLQGVLIARASGRTLPDFLAERIFEPLGMADSGFVVPAEKTVASCRSTGSSRTAVLVSRTRWWAANGASCRRSRPAPAGWSGRSTTGSPSPSCCSPRASSTAGACCRRSPYAR
ncbi:serine hydrolase domain-containing protein [Fodinicola feengrottensis]|uniref:serine hydrolase domain-containing protein n=1 Tax=Fodinicola feengrottensis TaxID=435914 RepID=UPI0024436024|nr:serine hydrolase [Fodinicola feengrottensis]